MSMRVFICQLFIFFFPFMAMAYDEIELETINSILQGSNRSLQTHIKNLEDGFTKSGFNCQQFDNSYSGSKVLKLKGRFSYVVKVLNKAGAEQPNEISVSKIAAAHSLAPKVFFSGNTKTYHYMVMEFLDALPLRQKMTWLNIDWELMGAAVSLVRSLHNCGAYFPPATTIYENTRDHFKLIEKHAIPVPNGYETMRDSFNGLMCVLVRLEDYKPCHFDFHGDNVFIGEKGLKLIDWDCAGTGNIYLELASISLEFRFSTDDDYKMLGIYFPFTSDSEKARFYIAKTLCLGVFCTRDFVRPYFEVFPPYLPTSEVKCAGYEFSSYFSSKKHPRYDKVLALARRGEPVDYDTDLKIGVLMLNEYIQRLRSTEMQYSLSFLRERAIARRMIISEHRLYESFLRNLLLKYLRIFTLYYGSRE